MIYYVQEQSRTSQLGVFVRDARRFILYFKQAIAISPLQTYVSALVFSPTSSAIQQTFGLEGPEWIITKPKTADDWSACLQTLEGHSNTVSSVAFSLDGAQLASGSWGNTIKLWDTKTGACTATLEGLSSEVSSVAFSPDGGEHQSSSSEKKEDLRCIKK